MKRKYAIFEVNVEIRRYNPIDFDTIEEAESFLIKNITQIDSITYTILPVYITDNHDS